MNIAEHYGVNMNEYRADIQEKILTLLAHAEKNSITLKKDAPIIYQQGIKISYVCAHCGKDKELRPFKFMEKTSTFCFDCQSENTAKEAELSAKKKLKEAGFKIKSVSKQKFEKSQWSLVCPLGHSFKKTGKSLASNLRANGVANCPCCWKSSGEEERVRFMLETHFNEPFKNVHPEWLMNPETNRCMELDMYCEKLKIAVEYNGIHHYEPIYGDEKLEGVQFKDALKQKICEEMGIRFIQIQGMKKSSSIKNHVENWKEQFEREGIFFSEDVVNQTIEIEINSAKSEGVVKELSEKIEKCNLSWVAGSYMNKHSSLTLKYNDCNHEIKKEVREVRRWDDETVVECRRCLVKSRQEAAATMMAITMGGKFESFVTNKGTIKGFTYKKAGVSVKVSEEKFVEFKKSHGIDVTKSGE